MPEAIHHANALILIVLMVLAFICIRELNHTMEQQFIITNTNLLILILLLITAVICIRKLNRIIKQQAIMTTTLDRFSSSTVTEPPVNAPAAADADDATAVPTNDLIRSQHAWVETWPGNQSAGYESETEGEREREREGSWDRSPETRKSGRRYADCESRLWKGF